MSDQYSPLPPTPDSLTAAELAILRNELSEPAVQAIIAALKRTGQNSVLAGALHSGCTYSNPLANKGWTKILIPMAVWTEAAGTQVLTLGTIPAKTRVTGCYLDVTEAYTLAGTVQIKVGHATDDDFFLLAGDVKTAAVTRGITDAAAGVGLSIAASIQSASIPAWAATKDLIVTLVSGTGDIGADGVTLLTTGISTLYIKLETLP